MSPKTEKLDKDALLLIEVAGVLDQVAGMLEEAKRIQMLTRSEEHIEFTDSQANHISSTLRRLVKRVETWR